MIRGFNTVQTFGPTIFALTLSYDPFSHINFRLTYITLIHITLTWWFNVTSFRRCYNYDPSPLFRTYALTRSEPPSLLNTLELHSIIVTLIYCVQIIGLSISHNSQPIIVTLPYSNTEILDQIYHKPL